VPFPHVIPTGPRPLYTIIAPARRGAKLEQWEQISARASDAVIECGGTITHHHAVGSDQPAWYDRKRPDVFAQRAGGQARGRPRTAHVSTRAC